MGSSGVPPITGVQKACDKMQGQKHLAEALGLTPQAVSLWVKQGFAPWERIHAITELTGVPGRELCDPRLAELLQG